MLQVSSLTKWYDAPDGPLTVLRDASFTMAPGDAAAVMGPSGSGKSTLLYIVGTLEPPSSGGVVLDGQDPFALRSRELARFRNRFVGFVFQDHCLLPQCTVLENVLTPTLVGGGGRDALSRARDLLQQVGLGHRLDHRPTQLSGGERQRASLARALINRPRLLLCDEPTGNLDRQSGERVASLLLDLHREQRTILVVVTHSLELARHFPQRFELADGTLRRVA